MGEEDTAKYMNTPETVLYHKSRVLYGLEQTREFIKKKNEAVVVEGELDAISSYQAGVKNVVAIKGSALTEEQVDLLKRYTDNLKLALDADSAGDQAARRGIELAEKAGLSVRVINLKFGKDPDECAQKSSRFWKDSVKTAVPIYDFYIDSSIKRNGVETPEGKRKIIGELAPILAGVSNQVIKSHYVKKLATVLGVDEEDVLARAENFHKERWDDTFEIVRQKDMKARELWDIIWKNSVESGDPGIYNIDLANKYTNVSYFEKLDSTNPCGEISLPSYGNCCLGNVNLSNMVLDNGRGVDWKRLARTVRIGVRFLDNVLTINSFPTDECKTVADRSRRIGLGVTGLHYMLIKLGLPYGNEKCLEFLERLFATIRDESYKQSVYLARDKTPFAEFDSKRYLNEEYAKTLPARIRMLIKRHGIRNAVMLTIPPCGTISMLHGVSSGIEPIFAAMYNRRWRSNNIWKEQLVVDPLFQQYYDEKKNLKPFVGAYDVAPEDHIKVQATIQKYIDSCISKTINLPATATPEEFSQAALDYAPYLKGLTVYRAGAKEGEPLAAIPFTEENIQKYMKKEHEVKVETGEACSLVGGECGA